MVKSSAVLAGRPRNNIAGLWKIFCSMYSMHLVVSSLRDDCFEFNTCTASGNESLGPDRNSGKPPSDAPGRKGLSFSLDWNFVISSSLGILSKMLLEMMLLWDKDRWRCERTLQDVATFARTQLGMICGKYSEYSTVICFNLSKTSLSYATNSWFLSPSWGMGPEMPPTVSLTEVQTMASLVPHFSVFF